ncbi:MAG: hypothetical protein RLO81_07090 [Fulvivirga sp.]|uniref:hypothetical protein n=1 Tax=Fulvivirga sp. TaxID=1931237 RepID=UPI0032EEEC01
MNMLTRFLFLSVSFVALFCTISLAQSKEPKNEKRDNSFAPMAEEQSAIQKKDMKKKGKKSYRAMFNKKMDKKIREYEERMEANAKQDRKERRLMKKPQYSDPMYFGHKKKPKKRPPGKRKLCKECHIWH